MTQQNIVTVIVVVASAIIPYLISQQDVTIAPIWKVVLTAANIGLAAFARLSNGGGETTTVTITQPTPDTKP